MLIVYMSSGYNLVFDNPYQNKIRKQVIEMEKRNPAWEPQLSNVGKSLLSHRLLGGVGVAQGQKSVGFNNYSKFSNFYQEVPKSYKSSGNEGYMYYHQNELDKINKGNMPYINYNKNSYDNSGKPVAMEDVKIDDSIKKVVENKFDASLLKGGKKRIVLSPIEKTLKDIVVRTAKKSNMSGGSIHKKDFIKALKVTEKVAKKVAPVAGRIAISAVAASVAQSVGIPVPIALMITNAALNEISDKISGGFKAIHPKHGISHIDGVLPHKARPMTRPILPHVAHKLERPLSSEEKILHDLIVNAVKPMKGGVYDGGKFDKKAFKKGLKITGKIAQTIGVPAAKIGIPVLAKQLGHTLGVDPKIAAMLGKVAADVVSSQIKNIGSGGVGVYKGGVFGEEASKIVGLKARKSKKLKTIGKVYKKISGGGADDKRTRRSNKVKDIMKEYKLSLPLASKYIKDNKIDY